MIRSDQHRKIWRWLLAGAISALVPLAAASPAVAADSGNDAGHTVYVGDRVGDRGNGVIQVWDGEVPSGEPDYLAYCLENRVDLRENAQGVVGTANDFLGDNFFTNDANVQSKVLWVLAHSYPALSLEEFGSAAGTPGISAADAAEATQYAIWRYTDVGFDSEWNWSGEDDSDATRDAYWYLVNGANAEEATWTDAQFQVDVSITGPATDQVAGTLVGPFVVSTNQPTVSVSTEVDAPLVDADGEEVDANAITDGQEIYLDMRDSDEAGSATLTASAQGSSLAGKIISIANPEVGEATAENHAQTLILVAPSTHATTASVEASWARVPVPTIGTSLVDAADSDSTLAWDGGTLTDTVSYQDLTPGVEYTLVGALMDKADGSATGIEANTTFTPADADGSIDVTFTVPQGYDGKTLVAFEALFEGTDTSGEAVATHEDINDQAQTVVVADEPEVDQPTDDEPIVDQPETDQPTDDQPTDDQPETDQPTDDEPQSDESAKKSETDGPRVVVADNQSELVSNEAELAKTGFGDALGLVSLSGAVLLAGVGLVARHRKEGAHIGR